MSAKDIIHEAVKNALIKDGWIITHDPFTVQYEDAQVFVDLGAERVVAAERQGKKIAIEIKSFVGRSEIQDMKVALGQYMIYQGFMEIQEPDRKLYVAVSDITYNGTLQRKSLQLLLKRYQVPLIVVDVEVEEVIEWIEN